MIFGKIEGTVVSAQIDKGIKGKKCLLVQTCNHKGDGDGNYLVAVDLIGAGVEEVVIISQGISAIRSPSFTCSSIFTTGLEGTPVCCLSKTST